MKNLNLENYGVQEMNEKEMMMVDGGWLVPGIRELARGGLLTEIWANAKQTAINIYNYQSSGEGYNGSASGFGPR